MRAPVALLVLLAAAPARGESDLDTLKRLVAEQRAEIDALKRQVQALEQRPPAANAANAGAPTVAFKGAPEFHSGDGRQSFKVRGRVQVDTALMSSREGGLDFSDGSDFRRARLGVEGAFSPHWRYRFEADFAPASGAEVVDAFVQYLPVERLVLTAGQHKAPNFLADVTSDLYGTFVEKPLVVSAFSVGSGDKLGLSLRRFGRSWSLAAGVFGENASVRGAVDEAAGVNARVTWAPVASDDALVHLGASGYHRRGQEAPLRIADRPEVRIDGRRLVSTGLLDLERYTMGAVELAGRAGPLWLQAEAAMLEGDPAEGPRARFDGHYVEGGWFLTGERRAYSAPTGTFERTAPRRPLGEGGFGAVELALRYSHIDLSDGAVRGGVETNWTAGLNWYATAHTRVLLDYIRFDVIDSFAEAPGPSASYAGDALALRLQVDW